MGGAAGGAAPVRRHLFRHARRSQGRGRFAAGTGDTGDDRSGGRSLTGAAGRAAGCDDRGVLHLSLARLGGTRAQDDGAPPFDIVLCDEAHRTTGIERPGDKTSPFVLVHDAQRVRAVQAALYDGDTAPLYGRRAKSKAGEPRCRSVLHGRPGDLRAGDFTACPSRASVEQDLAVRLQGRGPRDVREPCGYAALQGHLAAGGGEITLTDAAKIVGCWRALQNPENKQPRLPGRSSP